MRIGCVYLVSDRSKHGTVACMNSESAPTAVARNAPLTFVTHQAAAETWAQCVAPSSPWRQVSFRRNSFV